MRLKSVLLYAFLGAFLAVYSTGCETAPEPVEPQVEEPAPMPEPTPEPEPMPEPEPEPEPEPVIEEPEPMVESFEKTSHLVEKGECLWTISESSDVYSDPFQWPVIYRANRDQIKDPDLIYPDQEFEIPRNVSQQEIDDAVHEAKTRGPWSLWDGK